MNVEIEIKLRLPRDLAAIRGKLLELGFRVSRRRVFESNVLFDDHKRSLRKHGKLLRVRWAGGRGLLTYKGPSEPGPYKKRWEAETHLPDSAVIQDILRHVGYHPVFRYEKFRTEYTGWGDGKVLLDETPIGNFLELEGSPRWIDRTARRLAFTTRDYIKRSYGYLYLAFCRQRKLRPADMVFQSRPGTRR